MPRIITFLFLLILAGAGSCYYFFSPAMAHRREAQQALNRFSEAIETQKPDKVQAELAAMLDEHAQIALEVDFPALPGQQIKNAAADLFGKQEFIRFMDNTLYTLTHYHFKAHITGLTLSKDQKSSSAYFSGSTEADGMQMDGYMHFLGDVSCNAGLAYNGPKPPVITKLSCVIKLHYAAAGSH